MTTAGALADGDQPTAYAELAAARWIADGGPSMPKGLADLVPLALTDPTSLDALLARWVRSHLAALADEEPREAIPACEAGLVIGRPWVFGG